jgi:hypothetical protein
MSVESTSSSSFLLNYKKHNYNALKQSLELHPSCLLTNIKHYIPIYNLYFSLNSTNYNSISLNHKYVLDHLNLQEGQETSGDFDDEKNYSASLILSDETSTEEVRKKIFLKFSPLIDPVKYMINKYKDIDFDILRSIPDFDNIDDDKYKQLISYEENNTPYTDGFFTFLSSVLLNQHNFLNGIDFYGSCLGTKKEFHYNIVDEIDYLNDSDYFHENLEKLYTFQNLEHREIFNIDSRKNKAKLKIDPTKTCNDIVLDEITELLPEIMDDGVVSSRTAEQLNKGTDPTNIEELTEENLALFNTSERLSSDSPVNVAQAKSSRSSSTHSSSVSSNSSNTTNTEDHENDCASLEEETEGQKENPKTCSKDNGEEDEVDTEYSTCSSSEESEEEIMCTLFDFPVEAIFMEKCDNTLDYLMMNNMLNDSEWKACLFQVITILAVYQKCFDFTHNDLHTNNIMYIETDKQYLYYKINGTTYKVPTYGRIFKIIDFGRAIYKFRGKLICSNSFHERGDAGSQYNFGPYFNDKKEEVMPNKSFDLCRLACCLYDYFIEDQDEEQEIVSKSPLINMIISWLMDDKGRNILYKSNGEERYPEFKLYKMIARTIHNAVPTDQLKHDTFDSYKMSRSNLEKLKHKDRKIMNIDKIPSYVDVPLKGNQK